MPRPRGRGGARLVARLPQVNLAQGLDARWLRDPRGPPVPSPSASGRQGRRLGPAHDRPARVLGHQQRRVDRALGALPPKRELGLLLKLARDLAPLVPSQAGGQRPPTVVPNSARRRPSSRLILDPLVPAPPPDVLHRRHGARKVARRQPPVQVITAVAQVHQAREGGPHRWKRVLRPRLLLPLHAVHRVKVVLREALVGLPHEPDPLPGLLAPATGAWGHRRGVWPHRRERSPLPRRRRAGPRAAASLGLLPRGPDHLAGQLKGVEKPGPSGLWFPDLGGGLALLALRALPAAVMGRQHARHRDLGVPMALEVSPERRPGHRLVPDHNPRPRGRGHHVGQVLLVEELLHWPVEARRGGGVVVVSVLLRVDPEVGGQGGEVEALLVQVGQVGQVRHPVEVVVLEALEVLEVLEILLLLLLNALVVVLVVVNVVQLLQRHALRGRRAPPGDHIGGRPAQALPRRGVVLRVAVQERCSVNREQGLLGAPHVGSVQVVIRRAQLQVREVSVVRVVLVRAVIHLGVLGLIQGTDRQRVREREREKSLLGRESFVFFGLCFSRAKLTSSSSTSSV